MEENTKEESINVNVEIDYDKLATVIVQAQEKANKKETQPKNLRERAMGFMNGLLYAFIYLLAVLCIIEVWKDYTNHEFSLFAGIFSTIIFAFMGIYAFLCQQESFTDNGKDSLTHFNTNVTLIALVVALIALFKGVG